MVYIRLYTHKKHMSTKVYKKLDLFFLEIYYQKMQTVKLLNFKDLIASEAIKNQCDQTQVKKEIAVYLKLPTVTWRQTLYQWMTGFRHIPLRYFIKLKKRYANLSSDECPDYEDAFIEVSSDIESLYFVKKNEYRMSPLPSTEKIRINL